MGAWSCLRTCNVSSQWLLGQHGSGTSPLFRYKTGILNRRTWKRNTLYPPWENWDLDSEFLKRISEYCLQHSDTTLSLVLDNICCHIEAGKELFKVIPDRPFPARGLVKALACLVKLGVVSALVIASCSCFYLWNQMVSRVKASVYEFAREMVSWVDDVKSAFESTRRNDFTWIVWRNLRNVRCLLDLYRLQSVKSPCFTVGMS